MLGATVMHPQYSWGQLADGKMQSREGNGAFNAKNGELYLARHADPRSRPHIPGLAMEPSSESQTSDVAQGLSRRERLILRMLTEGASNKVIALKFVITESTVKVHMKTILRKLRLQNRTQAAMWARDHSSELASCA